MKHLLDVNVLLAAIWANHVDNGKTLAWLEEKPIALCPIAELGFLRISTNPNPPLAPQWIKRVRHCKRSNAKEKCNGLLTTWKRLIHLPRLPVS